MLISILIALYYLQYAGCTELFVSDSKVICEDAKDHVLSHLGIRNLSSVATVNQASHISGQKAFRAKREIIMQGRDRVAQVEELKIAMEQCHKIRKFDFSWVMIPGATIAQIIYVNRATLTAISFYTVCFQKRNLN